MQFSKIENRTIYLFSVKSKSMRQIIIYAIFFHNSIHSLIVCLQGHVTKPIQTLSNKYLLTFDIRSYTIP